MKRPNILYIFTDQQTADAMSCAGNDNLYTPNMDKLAAQGVRFKRAYCTYPLCTPCRASMFSGKMPHEVGVTQNSQSLTDEARQHSVGFLVEKFGYESAYAGKWHLPASLKEAVLIF
ncbi:MAG: sulfatase-like hydrolase/transferase [Lentisphaerae bacterium]|nr:sulfatase-like hydrolase/transferase [Lentisphaerota bacterium]